MGMLSILYVSTAYILTTDLKMMKKKNKTTKKTKTKPGMSCMYLFFKKKEILKK